MANHFCSLKTTKSLSAFLLAAVIALLAGCGGGGSPASTSTGGGTPTPTTVVTITGTVATGAPSAGAEVTVKDSAGRTATATSGAGGAFSVSVTGLTPPFMLAAVKSGQSNMYSILPAMDMTNGSKQNVNITPVTTLVLAELFSGDPAAKYLSGAFTTVTAASVSSAEALVRGKLPANSMNPIFSMLYGSFTASTTAAGSTNADPYDALLDRLGKITAITGTSVTFSIAAAYPLGSTGGTALPTMTVALTDTTAPFAARTSISSTNPARVTATLRNAIGSAIPGVIVTFAAADPRDSFIGGINTALTDSSGVAAVTLTTSNIAGGASSVTASATLPGAANATSSSLNYSIGSSTLTLSALTVPAAALSAYGTAGVSVNVLNNGVLYTTPMTVTFISSCASTGKATLTSSVTTVNGTATASYLDNGCNNSSPGDLITATLLNGVTATGNLKVNAPSLGSIQFVSVATTPATTPPMITLKGTGGANRSETARVTFRVVDSAGKPLGGALVNFSLNTSLGGLALSTASALSDPVTGNAVTDVLAGTFSTAVRVTAATGGLSTQSDQLVVSTGIPAQDAFSLSTSKFNITGGTNTDGLTAVLTARLADHFHNPVPDGTAVYFTGEGGSITSSCTTVGGACSATLTTQNPRPSNGRVTVLARATGEEAFIDLNGNGVADPGEMIDINGVSTDMGEAYVDYNEDGIWNSATEPFIDFNGDGAYTGTTNGASGVGGTASGDGKYNGVLCNATATPAFCSSQKSIDVRGSAVIVFSSAGAGITINSGNPIALPTCLNGVSQPLTFTVRVLDANGNAMGPGTTVAFSTTNGTITTPTAAITLPDTNRCRTGVGGCPALAADPTLGDITVTMKGDTLITTDPAGALVCGANQNTTGQFTVTVTAPTTPSTITTRSVQVTD